MDPVAQSPPGSGLRTSVFTQVPSRRSLLGWGCASPTTRTCRGPALQSCFPWRVLGLHLPRGRTARPLVELQEVPSAHFSSLMWCFWSFSGVPAAPPPAGNSANLLRVPWAPLIRPLSGRKRTGPSTDTWATLLMISLYQRFMLLINILYLTTGNNS